MTQSVWFFFSAAKVAADFVFMVIYKVEDLGAFARGPGEGHQCAQQSWSVLEHTKTVAVNRLSGQVSVKAKVGNGREWETKPIQGWAWTLAPGRLDF
eukprot:CAMPEP_0174346958 /NCGR_PEP_ID=MMETSP0811_2-20130205/2875_1 /TAXON_ID=73025 ORGANISM="Eutreptiella gymnastica-like, Strain CCMP1594" /NCGR_SAMPLE_ID=MMETSP0811_2 /ASSEMBLY_ACC=CAM_ASM_000667 /LENGTH=96 /DNA_ID=CAMNT_0015472053 /DNA_START=137 /DNA_END=424 /DNA_ORIENTATION=+